MLVDVVSGCQMLNFQVGKKVVSVCTATKTCFLRDAKVSAFSDHYFENYFHFESQGAKTDICHFSVAFLFSRARCDQQQRDNMVYAKNKSQMQSAKKGLWFLSTSLAKFSLNIKVVCLNRLFCLNTPCTMF